MGNYKGPTEGGAGGGRGHSGMEHGVYSEELKASSRRRRRQQTRTLARKAVIEHDTKPADNADR
ncbi:MAG: hypothetical protein H6993_06560 [Pseudomonadales bacterium]|nr:hypothetical protein [Pseudomonadales bacterium]MCP5183607.1 hypothetical protein [Pseudomonadales bacterium]